MFPNPAPEGADETEEASQRGPKVEDMGTQHRRRDTTVGGRDQTSDWAYVYISLR